MNAQHFRSTSWRYTSLEVNSLERLHALSLHALRCRAFNSCLTVLLSLEGLVGALELPFCCSFIRICRRVQALLAPVEVYWLRGMFYLLLAGVLTLYQFAIQHLDLWVLPPSCGLLVGGS